MGFLKILILTSHSGEKDDMYPDKDSCHQKSRMTGKLNWIIYTVTLFP